LRWGDCNESASARRTDDANNSAACDNKHATKRAIAACDQRAEDKEFGGLMEIE